MSGKTAKAYKAAQTALQELENEQQRIVRDIEMHPGHGDTGQVAELTQRLQAMEPELSAARIGAARAETTHYQELADQAAARAEELAGESEQTIGTWKKRIPYVVVVMLLIIGLLLIVAGAMLDSGWVLWAGFFVAIPGVALTILFLLLYFWLKRIFTSRRAPS